MPKAVGTQWSGTDRREDYIDYLERYPDIMKEARSWMDDTSNTHWANYVRSDPELFKDYFDRQPTDYAPNAGHLQGQSMWDYGAWHAGEFGYKGDSPRWKVMGSGDMPRTEMAIGDDIYDFAKWHWETKGSQKPNRTLRDMNEVRAAAAEAEKLRREEEARKRAEDRAAREASFQKMMADQQSQYMNQAAQAQEAARLSSLRIGSRNTLGSAGIATFKPKTSASTIKKGKGRGTDQFKRPATHSSTLSIAGTANTAPSTGLNIS